MTSMTSATDAAHSEWFWKVSPPGEQNSVREFAPHVGIEYACGWLQPNCGRTFEHVSFAYLPQRGLGAALLAHNLSLHARTMGFTQVLVDWPEVYESHVDTFLAASPLGIVLAPREFVAMGSLVGAVGDDALANVWLMEASNPRRLLLSALRKAHPKLRIHCTGGVDGNISVWASGDVMVADGSLPTESLLPYGLLPFLEGRLAAFRQSLPFAPKLAERVREDAEGLAVAVLTAEDTSCQTLVVADELTLLALPAALERLCAGGPGDASHMARNLVHLGERRRRGREAGLALARPTLEHHAQYAACNGFQSRALLTSFQSAEEAADASEQSPVTQTPLDAYRSSLSASFDASCQRYAEWTRQDVTPSERTSVFRYMYRLAVEEGRTFPSQFDMLLSAQSVVDSNLSYEWLKECRDFPTGPAAHASALPEIHLPLAAFTPQVSTLSIEKFDTIGRHRPKSRPRGLKREAPTPTGSQEGVDESKYADGKWVHEDHPYSCSFPDEDVFMEEFSFGLRKQASEKVRALETHTHELTTSLEDGLDLRETIRNWHTGKVMVREEVNLAKADIGAIVFNFAAPEDGDSYTWRAFWHAERHDNSHLLFFATPFQDSVIGPGVAKSEFGGFSVLPLGAVAFDPWHDPYIRSLCRTPLEALLLASALGTEEKSLLFLSNDPPPKSVASLIKRSGKIIIFQRLDQIPPDKIRRLRTFHILAEAGVRAYAQKYIRKET